MYGRLALILQDHRIDVENQRTHTQLNALATVPGAASRMRGDVTHRWKEPMMEPMTP
jgi:hypothetical protein